MTSRTVTFGVRDAWLSCSCRDADSAYDLNVTYRAHVSAGAHGERDEDLRCFVFWLKARQWRQLAQHIGSGSAGEIVPKSVDREESHERQILSVSALELVDRGTEFYLTLATHRDGRNVCVLVPAQV
jgi:hypothetical protein